MKREAGGPCLSAVFVDYDNIYLSLKRKSEEAAKRFAKEATRWLREIESGKLITPTNAQFGCAPRRIAMNRCYGNPVPRRNPHDNSTDMSSFPFVRHHFLRAGFEVIDCPPLTAQLKNSADIRMVMDIRDLLLHDTYFDEFIILSGDADFTPVLIRLRAHARRTVVFANDFTAAPYTAICDGEIREAALIELILAGELPEGTPGDAAGSGGTPVRSRIDEARREILAEVVAGVRASAAPVPLEALADRALRALGHEKTIATGWAGAGSFRELLRRSLPEEIRLTGDPPYLVFDARRHGDDRALKAALDARGPGAEASPAVQPAAPENAPAPSLRPVAVDTTPASRAEPHDASAKSHVLQQAPVGQRGEMPAQRRPDVHSAIQQSITRIHEACQAPALAPQEYRVLFDLIAKEISDNDLTGVQTLANIVERAREHGIEVRRDDVRFVLEVVSEADPWFEQGASADVFAARFRNFVVARCRGQGLKLSANEFELIDAWFGTGQAQQGRLGSSTTARLAPPASTGATEPATPPPLPALEARSSHWWSLEDNLELRGGGPEGQGSAHDAGPFPRVARSR
jgi:NYN domain-containing protein